MSQEVRVGDSTYRVQPFNGRKAIIAGRALARIGKKVPTLLQDDAAFQRSYREEHTLVITRAMAQAEPWRAALAHMSDADWKALDGEIRLPQSPSDEERLFAVFPAIFEVAEQEVLQLLALLVVPNSELADAAREGDPKAKLQEYAERLLDQGDIGELAEVAAVGIEELRTVFDQRGGAVGKLRTLWARDPEAPAADSAQTTTSSSSEISPSGSTDSPPPTDGESDERSTEPASDSLSPSLSE